MNIAIVFFLGLIVAFIGVIPPGLLNMTAAKISLKEGNTRGVVFSIGASIVVLIQTYIATIFARYLSKHPEVIGVLKIVALAIFILITIYFLFIAKGERKQEIKPKVKSKHSRFFQGILMSSINVFPIPYQAYMTITLASFKWMDFSQESILVYMVATAIGSFIVFYFYILFFEKMKFLQSTSQKNMNYLIGGVTGVISIITIINF